MSTKETSINAVFWFHVFITVLSWVAPFLIDWRIMIPVYIIIQLQFSLLGKCVMNEHHDLEEKDNYTLYAFMFEQLGFNVNRNAMHFYVRKISNSLYSLVAILWQVVLGIKPLLVLPY